MTPLADISYRDLEERVPELGREEITFNEGTTLPQIQLGIASVPFIFIIVLVSD